MAFGGWRWGAGPGGGVPPAQRVCAPRRPQAVRPWLSSAMRRGEAPGSAGQAGCAREIAEIGPESGRDRVSPCQAERWRDCAIPDTGEVRGSRGGGGRPRQGPGAPSHEPRPRNAGPGAPGGLARARG